MNTLPAFDNTTIIPPHPLESPELEPFTSKDDQYTGNLYHHFQCTFPIGTELSTPKTYSHKMRDRPSPITLCDNGIEPKLVNDLFAVTPLTKMIIELPSPVLETRTNAPSLCSPQDPKAVNIDGGFRKMQDLITNEDLGTISQPSTPFSVPRLLFNQIQTESSQSQPQTMTIAVPDITSSTVNNNSKDFTNLERITKNYDSANITEAVKNIRAILLPNGRYKCSECSRTYKHAKHVRRHSTVHAMSRHDLYTCQQCFHRFTRCDALTRHVKSHQKPKKRSQIARVSKTEN